MSMGDLSKIKDLYFDGDMNAAPALAGQSSGLINEIKSVKNIIDETINEYNQTCIDLSKNYFKYVFFKHKTFFFLLQSSYIILDNIYFI
jgi:hypothetical protein